MASPYVSVDSHCTTSPGEGKDGGKPYETLDTGVTTGTFCNLTAHKQGLHYTPMQVFVVLWWWVHNIIEKATFGSLLPVICCYWQPLVMVNY